MSLESMAAEIAFEPRIFRCQPDDLWLCCGRVKWKIRGRRNKVLFALATPSCRIQSFSFRQPIARTAETRQAFIRRNPNTPIWRCNRFCKIVRARLQSLTHFLTVKPLEIFCSRTQNCDTGSPPNAIPKRQTFISIQFFLNHCIPVTNSLICFRSRPQASQWP